MKKIVTLLLVFLITLLSTTSVQADMGPKPSLTIEVIGITEEYYFDVLVDVDPTDEEEPYDYYTDFPDALRNYQDEDGFSSYSLYEVPASVKQTVNNNQSQTYELNYIAPNEFKMVIVMKDTNIIIKTDVLNTKAFETDIQWDLSNVDLTKAQSGDIGIISGNINGYQTFFESVGYKTAINSIIRLLVTIIVEVAILLAFNIKTKKAITLVVIVNAITNLFVGTLLISIYLTSGALAFVFMTIVLELVVLLFELVVYSVKLKEISMIKIVLYTILANAVTFILGILLMTV